MRKRRPAIAEAIEVGLLALLLLLPGMARAGDDIARLGVGEVLEVEIQFSSGRNRPPTNYLYRVEGGETRRHSISVLRKSELPPRLEQEYDGVPTPAMEANLQLWIDLYREVGSVQDTSYRVHERFVLRRYAGESLVQSEKRFDLHRMTGLIMEFSERNRPVVHGVEGLYGIYGWYVPQRPPDTAGLGRLRTKIADPERYRGLDYPLALVPARREHKRAVETLDSLSKGLD